MDTDGRERRQQLERIAFGRTYGRQDEEAAAAARKELADTDRAAQLAARNLATSQDLSTRRQVEADDLDSATSEPDDDLLLPPPPPPPRRVARRIRPAWLVPIIAASIAVGYFGPTIAVAGALQEPVLLTGPIVPSPVFVSPTPEPPPTDGVSAGQPSSLKEADAWFETLPRDSDAVLDPGVVQGLELDPAAIRFVQADAANFQVWVARKLNGDLCVVGSEAEGVSAFTGCNTREGFARSGITISQRDYSMTWNGSSVTVTMPRPVDTP